MVICCMAINMKFLFKFLRIYAICPIFGRKESYGEIES